MGGWQEIAKRSCERPGEQVDRGLTNQRVSAPIGLNR
jgi:hypothetical protein